MNWKLGSVAGIPIYIHWSFWLLPLFVLMSSSAIGGGMIWQMLLLFAIFGCVILHELGHAMMARGFCVPTRDITLYPIGGVASLMRMPRSSFAEAAIALAGPAVNVILVGLLGMLQLITVFTLGGGGLFVFLNSLLYANIVLAVFNLLPVFPLDGGRVLRALLGTRMSYLRATEIAARVGQIFAIILGVYGFLSGGTLLLIAIFVYFAAAAELRMARLQASGYPEEFESQEPPERGSHPRTSARRPYVLLDNHGRVISTYDVQNY